MTTASRNVGSMRARILSRDWATTPIGPKESWPPILSALIQTLLAQPWPAGLVCGPQRVLLCNDAGAPLLCSRSGQGEVLGPKLNPHWVDAVAACERAFAGEATTIVNSTEQREQGRKPLSAYFSPVPDESGKVAWVQILLAEASPPIGAADPRPRAIDLLHQVRNMLGVVRSLVRRTAETSDTVEDYAMHLEGRLNALSRVQSLITTSDAGADVPLDMLISDQVLALGGREDRRVSVSGPLIRLPPRTAELLGLAVHELATNAMKYGALAPGDGRLRINWRIVEGEPRRMNLVWKETVSAAPLERHRNGFGLELLTKGLNYEFGARTVWTLQESGLLCEIELPLTAQNAS